MNSREIAQRVVEWYDGDVLSLRGLKRLGSGWSRVAYLYKGKVVKIELSGLDFEANGINANEYEAYLHCKTLTLPDPWRVPEFELFTFSGRDVIVCDYIKGAPGPGCDSFFTPHCTCSGPCANDLYNDFMSATGISDVMLANVIVNDEAWWAIDLGCIDW